MLLSSGPANTSSVLLLKTGASPNLQKDQGLTAFDLALALGQAEALGLLLQHTGTYPHQGRVRDAFGTLIAAGNAEKLVPLIQDATLGRLLARAVAAQIMGDADQEPKDTLVKTTWSRLLSSLGAASDRELPQRHPRIMTEEEVVDARCVLGDHFAASFGRPHH